MVWQYRMNSAGHTKADVMGVAAAHEPKAAQAAAPHAIDKSRHTGKSQSPDLRLHSGQNEDRTVMHTAP
jgi:hypothetical protein